MRLVKLWTGLAVCAISLSTFCMSGCGGGSSSGATVSTASISSIMPTSTTVNMGDFVLNVYGTNFSQASKVQLNGLSLSTTYDSSTQLTAVVPAADSATAGTFAIAVAGSNSVSLVVNNPSASVQSVSPNLLTAGSVATTLTVNGTSFISQAQVLWGGSALPTTFVSSTQLTAQVPSSDLSSAGSVRISVANPSPTLASGASVVFYITAASTKMQTVAAYANDLVWDETRSRIYASLAPINNGTNNNTVAVIDPVAATIVSATPAGHTPNLMSLSSDAAHLWVGQDGDNAVQRFAIAGWTPDAFISLPLDALPLSHQPEVALAVEAAPVNPHTVAILAGNNSISPRDTGGITVYDDSVPRPVAVNQMTAFAVDFDWIQWGADDSSLFGGLLGIPTILTQTKIDPTGIVVAAGSRGAGTSIGHYDRATDALYDDGGEVENPHTFFPKGNYDLTNNILGQTSMVAVDSAQGVVFFLLQDGSVGGFVIQAFDQKTFRLLRSLSLPNISGLPSKFIRWGDAGLAFSTTPYAYQTVVQIPGTIYLVDGGFVNGSVVPDFTGGVGVLTTPNLTAISPQSASAGSVNVTLTVTGTSFEQGAVVQLGKTALNTTYVSPTEVQAVIPSSALSSPSVSAVTVNNGDNQSVAVVPLDFTVVPSGATYSPINLAAWDVAWDAKSGYLYAAVSGNDAQSPNSIAVIDPATGKTTKSQYGGSDPYRVRTTSDGSYLYSSTLYDGTITRVNLPDLDAPLTWTLPPDPTTPNTVAADLQAAPGSPGTLAVSTFYPEYDPEWPPFGASPAGGLYVYDDGVLLPDSLLTAQTRSVYTHPLWGATSATLYSVCQNSELCTHPVTDAGVGEPTSSVYNELFDTEPGLQFDPGTGNIYGFDGNVFSAATGNVVGKFASSGLLVADPSINRVFILGRGLSGPEIADYTITSYNMNTYAPVGSIKISSVLNYPIKMVRWGTSGLAIITYLDYSNLVGQSWGMMYLVNDSAFVSSKDVPGGNVLAPETVHLDWRIAVQNSRRRRQQRTTRGQTGAR